MAIVTQLHTSQSRLTCWLKKFQPNRWMKRRSAKLIIRVTYKYNKPRIWVINCINQMNLPRIENALELLILRTTTRVWILEQIRLTSVFGVACIIVPPTLWWLSDINDRRYTVIAQDVCTDDKPYSLAIGKSRLRGRSSEEQFRGSSELLELNSTKELIHLQNNWHRMLLDPLELPPSNKGYHNLPFCHLFCPVSTGIPFAY